MNAIGTSMEFIKYVVGWLAGYILRITYWKVFTGIHFQEVNKTLLSLM
jgi:hypothetical protein